RSKIHRTPHPIDAAERPVLLQAVPRVERHVLALVQLIWRPEVLPWNFDAAEPHGPVPRGDPPPRRVLGVVRAGCMAYPYREVECEVITVSMHGRAQIAHQGNSEEAPQSKPGEKVP